MLRRDRASTQADGLLGLLCHITGIATKRNFCCPEQNFRSIARQMDATAEHKHRLDFRDAEHTQVRLPLMKPIERIVIRTQIFGNTLTSNRLLKHPAKRPTTDDSSLNCKSGDAARVLSHNDQHPRRPQCHGFAAQEIRAPE